MPSRFPESPSQDRSHLLTQEALPWIVNGRASDEQRAEVEKHLAQCADCRDELQTQQQVQAAMALAPTRMPDEQAGLDKLLERIEMDALCDQPLPKSMAGARRHGGRLTYALATFAVLQAFALAFMGHRLSEQDPSAFQTLSSPPAPGTAAVGQPNAIRVVPDGRITLADWKALLDSLNLQVVSGPNAMGAYAVSAKDMRQSNTQALERLRSTPGMQMVEPIGGPP